MKIKTRRSLSFAGCGFLGIYHVGVAVCLRQHAPQLLLERIAGASAGALAACCLICDLPLEGMAGDFLRVVQETRRHSLGAFSPWFNLPECLLEGMHRRLPPDAHLRVNGRLHISLTRVSDRRNVVMSEFSSRQELLQALLCTCFIPGLSGLLPPQVRGVRYMDGAFSNNLPMLDEHTVTVSPFCGESDISPRDQNPHLLQLNINWANTCIRLSRRNMRRMVRILFPGRSDFMGNFCQQGYDDALHFLRKNSLLKEGYKVQAGGMVSWIQQQEEIEAKRLEVKRCHEKELKESKDSDQKLKENQEKSQEEQQLQRKQQKNQKRQKKNQKKTKLQNKEQQDDGKNLMLVPENHRHCYAFALMSTTWSLLRRVMTPPPLARRVVRAIAGHLSRSLTLLEQPHFDLALMHAPSSSSASASSTSTSSSSSSSSCPCF